MKLQKRENIIVYIITVILTIINYITFLKGYFSIDTPKILSLGYDGYAYYYSLYDGRLLMFIIGIIANIIQVGIKQYYIILLVFSIFISSISVMKIYGIITQIKPTNRKIIKLLIFIACYCYIFHFMNIDNFKWIECIIISISVLLYILAAERIILKNQSILGNILCLLGIICYQGTINVFIATSVLFMFIQTSKVNKKYILRKMFCLAISLLLSVGIDVIIVKIIQANIQSIQIDRINSDIILNLASNIKLLPNLIFYTLKMYPRFLHIFFIIIFMSFSYIYAIKNNNIKTFFYGVFIIIICYASGLIIGVISPQIIWMNNGRCFGAVGSLISAYILFLYTNTRIFESKIYKQIGIGIVILYFITIIVNTQYMTVKYQSDNEIDKEFSMQIVSQIEKYEQESNKKITKIAFNFIIDENLHKKENGTQSQKKLSTFDCIQLKLYANKEVKRVVFEDEVKEKYFTEQSDKMLCMEDTIYVQAII